MNIEAGNLIVALGIVAVGFVSIGPNILAIIGTSMERGRKDGSRLALGVGFGSGIWAIITVAGLTTLVTAYAGFMTLLKLFGAGYLLWLAYKAFRSAAAVDANVKPEATAGDNLFLKGILIQMTNPKAALQWIAIVSLGLGTDAPLWAGITLIVSATIISVFGHIMYAITFSTQRAIVTYRRFRRLIESSLGVFFSIAAYKLATHEK